MTAAARHTAVIGAGWAGCAAAVELAAAGRVVTLFEAARTPGGRARQVTFHGLSLDNGQHILLGAYRETLRLMHQVGIDPDTAMLRLPLQMRYPPGTGMNFVAPALPAPWHLVVALWRASGLTRTDKLALMRFSSAARWMDWHLNTDCSVTELLARFDQTATLVQLMWRPLCIAALNTPPERASAQVFLNVLKDSLGARRASSDMLLPRCDLSSLFPHQAAQYVEQRHGRLLAGTRITGIVRQDHGWQLTSAGATHNADEIVLATDSGNAATLLAPLADISVLQALNHEPITTCYLQYPPDRRLPEPFHALVDDPQQQHWGQFVFDRGQLDARHDGLFAVVVSASTEAIAAGQTTLAAAIAQQLAQAFSRPELTVPIWSQVISEKRATFSCTPGLLRPDNRTAFANLMLAGDYTASAYPSTIESAVRSGVAAAGALLARD
ncbi:hydroxysqualene dehydroxylase HpnE [Actimicrobium sp. CCC2.4]|uniref:hydroxysqualene dehydroxylase HpnE n=1 Tax=Actimicrobium sp. CCC2.4 TaxID=3048606 RepID=UPI002AC8CEF9|nr:hydroxysqualene dehydroxylase HpnE [Actimicrobium sp. CCC2.4]MEB0133878.1 hydroxysqualene dehydroxylase HpnE [Actimicrobium sp. CCC2.4]WPX31419.1 hydroxysqualene dehydroxylase HpnE [Actimicrobium sp. CCC2.4]